MKLVRFNRVMAPHAKGDTRAVPDDLATRLVAEGDAEIVPSVFDRKAPVEETTPRRRAARAPAKRLI